MRLRAGMLAEHGNSVTLFARIDEELFSPLFNAQRALQIIQSTPPFMTVYLHFSDNSLRGTRFNSFRKTKS